ncbi:MAG TPA: CoA transferase [Tepidiformaceae bacterium]|nr:CoA transferase [Tepidiformaceae bacterium]
MADLPLAGVRICDLTWVIAGPTATRVLADFGAEVIRVEHGQAADPIRFGRPILSGKPTLNNSGFFNYFNRNKKSVLLNVRHPLGMELLHRLIAVSDVVIENFSSGVLDSWELSYEAQKAINPAIIYCSVSGFGHSGRDKRFTTWGPTAQALSGLTLMSGLPGKPPAGWGYSYMDHTAGYYSAIAVMMALHHRNMTGEGQHIDISQVEAGMVLTGPAVLDYTVNGRSFRREGMPTGNRAWEPAMAPHNTYRCAGEDRWIAVACRNDAEWAAMVRAMGEPAWADARFETLAGRLEYQDELDARVGEWTASREDYAVMATLQAAGVPAGVCQGPSDRVERDEQFRARGWWTSMAHAELGPEAGIDGVTPRLARTPGTNRTASPLLGEHTLDVMTGLLGMTGDEFAEYTEMGVFM